ncbi:MAG: response regulator, partial [Chloroflexota bacterium]|nr:response regulator [Chloroflexota bacterium]
MQRILVADDDSSVRAILKELLESEGYTVDEAGDGAQVLSALGNENGKTPDLVLMDVRMPDKTG